MYPPSCDLCLIWNHHYWLCMSPLSWYDTWIQWEGINHIEHYTWCWLSKNHGVDLVKIIGIRWGQPFRLGLNPVTHIGIGVRVSVNIQYEGCLGLSILHILEYTTTLGNKKAIRTGITHNIIPENLCGGRHGVSKTWKGWSVLFWGRCWGCVKFRGRWEDIFCHIRIGQRILNRSEKPTMYSILNPCWHCTFSFSLWMLLGMIYTLIKEVECPINGQL